MDYAAVELIVFIDERDPAFFTGRTLSLPIVTAAMGRKLSYAVFSFGRRAYRR
jgi:hypothetical protein